MVVNKGVNGGEFQNNFLSLSILSLLSVGGGRGVFRAIGVIKLAFFYDEIYIGSDLLNGDYLLLTSFRIGG